MIKEIKEIICNMSGMKSVYEVPNNSEEDNLSIPPTPPPLPPPSVMAVFLDPLKVLHAWNILYVMYELNMHECMLSYIYQFILNVAKFIVML